MTEESLFAAVIALPTDAERKAYLERACGEDLALRRRLERLVAANAVANGVLEQPVGPSAEDVDTEFTLSATGRSVDEAQSGATIADRYTLLESIGEGGMGEVWLAEQISPVRRRVALKLIKPGMDTRTVLRRFEAERQALALMDHPHIAKVLDGGTTESGRPFFVMEYVQGAPLTHFCDEHRLSVNQRLELFAMVCQAVQHAHTKGVVHRDLKPGNVLVAMADGKAVPKVIDFGLAKALHEPLTEHSFQTVHGVMLGTPLYMSPEQAEFHNLDVDTRTDIYALGVILYELVTGTTPLERGRFHKAPWFEMLRIIKEEEPPRPSARLSSSETLPSLAAQRCVGPEQLTRLVRGELDWIVMKCLEKDRERRYETADALGRDVARFLRDETVEAYPPTFHYRLVKAVRRNRRAAISAGLIVVALLVGIAGTGWGLVRANRAREAEAKRANGERLANAMAGERLKQVEEGIDVLTAIFHDLDPLAEEKEDRPLRAILGDRLVQAADQIVGGRIADPLVLADLQNRLGLSLLHLDLAPEAAKALEKAHSTRATLLGEHHPKTLESLNNLASARKAEGNYDLAAQLFDDALQRLTATLGPADPATLTTMNNLAQVDVAAGKLDQAVTLFQRTLSRRTETLGPTHRDTLESTNDLAMAHEALGQLDQALPLFERTLELRRQVLGTDHAETLKSMNNLAEGYRSLGKIEAALPLLEEVLRISRVKFGNEHVDTLSGMNNLGLAYQAQGRSDLALPLLEEAWKTTRAKRGPDHPRSLVTMNALAGVYRATGAIDQATGLYEDEYHRLKAVLGRDHPHTLDGMNNLAVAYRTAGKIDKALPLLEEAHQAIYDKLGPDHPSRLACASNLASALQAAGQLDRAILLYEEALERCRETLGDDHPQTISGMNNLSAAYRRAGRKDESLELLREAVSALEAQNFARQDAGRILFNWFGSLEERDRFAEAEVWRRKWIETIRKRPGGPGSPPFAEELAGLGRNLALQEKWAEAAVFLREVLATTTDGTAASPARDQVQSMLGKALLKDGKLEEAEAVFRACLQFRELERPDEWTTFQTRSLLGATLLSQRRFEEAEPLLVSGHKGLKERESQMPRPAQGRLKEAADRVTDLYESWGKPAKLAEWRSQIEAGR